MAYDLRTDTMVPLTQERYDAEMKDLQRLAAFRHSLKELIRQTESEAEAYNRMRLEAAE